MDIEVDINMEGLVEELLTNSHTLFNPAGCQRFFQVLTTASFRDRALSPFEHYRSITYTADLLTGFVNPSEKYANLFDYFIELEEEISRDKERDRPEMITINKSFADHFYFLIGLFPETFDRKLGQIGFYVDQTKAVYLGLSQENQDVFDMLGNNIIKYIYALHHMRDSYLNGNFQRRKKELEIRQDLQ